MKEPPRLRALLCKKEGHAVKFPFSFPRNDLVSLLLPEFNFG
jgi:hypothetical protein